MSNQFTYEIDERNLRTQLRELEVPLKEDSWHKFEAFSDTQVGQHTSSPLRNFNLNLNRNVVLPVVFGVIIVLFSLLMVNFISIKNPKKESAQNSAASPAVSQELQINSQKPAAMAKPQPQVQPEQKNADALNVAEVKAGTEQPAADIASAVTSEPQQTAPQLPATEITSETSATAAVKVEAPEKKKRKRRSSDVVDPELLQIRPTLVSESEEENIRPN